MSRPKLLLADDHTMFSQGLQSLLEDEFELVGMVADGQALVDAALRVNPDVIVVDISMPVMNGFDAVRQLKKHSVTAKIIFLTMHADDRLLAEAFRCGGSGYVLKQSAGEELIACIKQVLAGHKYVTPLIATEWAEDLSRRVNGAQKLTDPVTKKLVDFIPRANFTDSSGAARFVGSAPVFVVVDQWAVDISHKFNDSDEANGYYSIQHDDRNEPTALGNTIPVKPTLDLALALHPETQRVVVVAGNTTFDQGLLAMAQKEFRDYEGRAAFTYLTGLTPEEIRQRLAVLPDKTIVIFLSFLGDSSGKAYANPEVVSLLASSSGAPIYGPSQTFLGHGIVGGRLLSYEAIGLSAGQMGLRILGGESPQSIAPQTVPSVTMFDWRQLRRWGIDESKLPPGSIVRYKEFSVWELYKWRIVGTIALIILQALLIVWLLVLRAKRIRAQAESARFAALVEAEHRRLEEIVANVQGIVWETWLKPGSTERKTTFVSSYAEKMLGYPVDQWLSTSRFGLSLMPEEDRERATRESEAVIGSGKEGISQFRWVAKDGRILWIETYLAAICDETGKTVGLRGVSVDITDRKKAEEALKENQAQLAGIIGSAMDAIISIDERQRVVLFNAAAETMFGCSKSEAIGQPLNRFIPTPFRDAHPEHLGALAKGNGTHLFAGSFEALMGRNADGNNFPIDVSISAVELKGQRFYTIILRDITDRLKAEQNLRDRREELKEAQRIAKVGSWEWEPVNDTVVWSEELFRVMGRDPGLPAPTYRQHPSLYIPESWDRLRSAVETCLETGKAYELELETIRGDGKVIWTNARGEILRDASGNVLKLRGTLQDIAERKHAEEALRRAIEEVSQLKNKLEEENIYLREEIKLAHNFDEIVGRSDATKYVLFKIEQVAPTDSTVLITGETGTGKELVARAIHSASSRGDRPLVKVNCAALSATLIESELFGHEKGAFTGATARKIGRFELANDATIFLDEIGELPLDLQVKLLRVIQEGEYERLGSSKTIKVNARIIAATNRNLKTAVEQGAFREDLWYRLNVFPITVPPLKDRKEDIPDLVQHFVRRFAEKIGKDISSISPAALKVLQDYSWPGNVRELANVIERAVINSEGRVLRLADHLDETPREEIVPSNVTLEEMERKHIVNVLENTGWRIEGGKGAARILGLNPSTLRTRMVKLGIQKVDQNVASASVAK